MNRDKIYVIYYIILLDHVKNKMSTVELSLIINWFSKFIVVFYIFFKAI